MTTAKRITTTVEARLMWIIGGDTYDDRNHAAAALRAEYADRLDDEYPGGNDGTTFGQIIDEWEDGADVDDLLDITEQEREETVEARVSKDFADGLPWRKDPAPSGDRWDPLAECRVWSTTPPDINTIRKRFTDMDTSEETIMRHDPLEYDADMAARMYAHLLQALCEGSGQHITTDGRLLFNFPSKPGLSPAQHMDETAWKMLAHPIADFCRYDHLHHTSQISFVYNRERKAWVSANVDDDVWELSNERNQPRAFDSILRGLGWRRISPWTTRKNNGVTEYVCQAAWMKEKPTSSLTPATLLKWLRTVSGMSQSQLGNASHVPAARIGDYEQGTRNISGASLEVVSRLADALHVSVDLFAHPELI